MEPEGKSKQKTSHWTLSWAKFPLQMLKINFNIIACRGATIEGGFDWWRFTDHLQGVTTSNYNSIAISTLYSSQSIVLSLLLDVSW
jgi:hypothetical protein